MLLKNKFNIFILSIKLITKIQQSIIVNLEKVIGQKYSKNKNKNRLLIVKIIIINSKNKRIHLCLWDRQYL